MDHKHWHLAEINVARARAPLSDSLMAGFVAQLDAINQLAEESPGFIWRLKGETGGPSSYIRFTEDERVIVNISVWSSIETLRQYVYRSAHGFAFRDRNQWFEAMPEVQVALWWVPAGQLPTIAEAVHRLETIRRHGPTQEAFTFKKVFPPPDAA